MNPFIDYALGIGTLGLVGWLMARDPEPRTPRIIEWLAGTRPLRIDEALTGPPPARRRRWGVQPRQVRDWQTDADLHEVA